MLKMSLLVNVQVVKKGYESLMYSDYQQRGIVFLGGGNHSDLYIKRVLCCVLLLHVAVIMNRP